ncbi:MAG: GNAT family N-acetyltransferase [Candidatus Woesearchaeota archaeon]
MNIIHDEKNHRFYCVTDGKECLVEYSVEGDVIDFYHTYVPLSLRGKGIAKTIYDHVYDWLKGRERNGEKLKIKTSCSYAEKYFNEKNRVSK